MKMVTATELRGRLSDILDRVRKGGEVVITLHGESIAILKPMHAAKKPFNPVGFGIWKSKRKTKKSGKSQARSSQLR